MAPWEKISYRLLDSVVAKSGVKNIVRQVYVKRGSKDGEPDEVIVLKWKAGETTARSPDG
jgi:hypothetical protein